MQAITSEQAAGKTFKRFVGGSCGANVGLIVFEDGSFFAVRGQGDYEGGIDGVEEIKPADFHWSHLQDNALAIEIGLTSQAEIDRRQIEGVKLFEDQERLQFERLKNKFG